MKSHSVKQYVWYCFFIFLVSAVTINCSGGGGGDSGDGGESGLTPNDIVFAEVTGTESPISAVATTNDGTEGIGVLAERDTAGNPTKVTGAVYTSEQGAAGILEVGSDGLPESLTDSSGIKAVFENYKDSTVDISIFDASGNLIEGPITVSVDPATLKEIKDLFNSISFGSTIESSQVLVETSDVSLSQWVKPALQGLSVGLSFAGCAVSIASAIGTAGLTIPVAVLSCGSLLLKAVSLVTEDEFDDALRTDVGAVSCIFVPSGYLGSTLTCLNTLIGVIIAPEPTPEPTPTPTPPPIGCLPVFETPCGTSCAPFPPDQIICADSSTGRHVFEGCDLTFCDASELCVPQTCCPADAPFLCSFETIPGVPFGHTTCAPDPSICP